MLDYNDFELQISKEEDGLFKASVIDNRSVAAENTFELRTNELKVIEILRHLEESSTNNDEKEILHEEFGRDLYNKVFSGELKGYFKKCLEDEEKIGNGLRICLRFHENAQEISALPWEFLHDGGFLSTDRNILISRLPVGIKKKESSPIESILRMLVVVSSPDDPDVAPLNIEHEQEVIIAAVDKLQREQKMEVEFTEDASFETIESYLNEKDYHIVHFTGHGKYDNGRGYLLLETEDGKARPVDNNAVSDLLAGRGVRLVVLSTCQSGKTSNREAYADLASILVKKNIPAVVAMQYSILDSSATKFAETFYHAIASKKPVDLALTEARIVMKNAENSNGIDFATPVLYLSDPECITLGDIKPEESGISNKPMMLADVQIMNRGFVGRKKQLRLLQKDFMSDVKRAAIIHGFGGIGKTVLATRLALKMNKHFDGVFGMKCGDTTKPEDILNELNGFLNMAGISDFNKILYEPAPLKVKTAVLVNILNQKRFLIIFDNFEDTLNEERSSIANPELKEFIQHLLNGTISNTKFIITTRYNFDPLEGRLTGAIEHIQLPEMPFPQTVWLMNTYKELADLEPKKKHEIFKAIGGHPWTIGQFVKHAAVQGVDSLMLELEPLRKEVINFTLLDKSYSLLDEKAKKLLLSASIYQEAIPIEALMWIIGDEDQPSPPVEDALSRLMDWGLMVKERVRDENLYTMHTLVRDFAVEEFGTEKLDRKLLLVRAAQYYENLVKTTKNLWDLLKAREYYFRAEEWKKASKMVIITTENLHRWGYIELILNLLNQSIETTSGITKAAAMGNLAIILTDLGDWKTALKLYNETKEIFEIEGDKRQVSYALHWIGNIHSSQGNYEEAGKLYQESLKITEELGDKSSIAYTLHGLGIMHHQQENYEEAMEKYQQSLEIQESLGNKSGVARSLHHLGLIHQEQGNYEGAVEKYQQCIKIFEEFGDKKGISATLHQLGRIHLEQGNYEEAMEKYQQSLEIQESIGDKNGIAGTLHELGMIHEKHDEDFPAALEKYIIAYSIFKELKSPNAEITGNSIARLKEKMGEEAFNKAFEEIRGKHGA